MYSINHRLISWYFISPLYFELILFLCQQYRISRDSVALVLLNHLLNSFISTICGVTSNRPFSSLCALKWLFRAFSYSVIQNTLYIQDSPLCSVGSSGVRLLITFVAEKFSSMSQILRAQIYQGLLPFLLSVGYSEDSNSHPAFAPFFDILEQFGIRAILQSDHSWKNITRSLISSLSDDFITVKAPRENRYLPIIVGVIGSYFDSCSNKVDNLSNQLQKVMELCDNLFQTANILFSKPYTDINDQLSVIWFMDSVTSILCSELNMETSDDRSVSVIYDESFKGCFSYLMDGVCSCVLQYSSFLAFLSISTIRSTLQQSNRMKINIPTLSDFRQLLKCFTELLLVAFVHPRVSTFLFQSILNIHVTFLRECHNLFLTLESHDDNHISSIFLTVCSISQILHNFRCVSKILKKKTTPIRLEKCRELNENIALLFEIFQSFSFLQPISSTMYQSSLKASFQEEDSIAISVFHEYSSYGKFSDEMIGYRWLVLSSIVDTVEELHLQFQFSTPLSFEPFIVELLQAAIRDVDNCSTHSISEVLSACRLLVQCSSRSSVLSNQSIMLQDLIQSSWNCCFHTDDISYSNVKLFILLCFSTAVMPLLGETTLQEYFSEIVKYSSHSKPFILQFLIYHLTSLAINTNDHSVMSPFLPFMKDLLIYREPVHDEHCQSDEYLNLDSKDGLYAYSIYGVLDYTRVYNIDRLTSNMSVRVLLLIYLEYLQINSIAGSYQQLQELFVNLLTLNSQCYKSFATIGSEKFGEKLRCWQSLCVLVHSVDSNLCTQIQNQIIGCLSDSMAHAIRVHVELCCAKLLERFPSIMLPPLLNILSKFNHSQQVSYRVYSTQCFLDSGIIFCCYWVLSQQ